MTAPDGHQAGLARPGTEAYTAATGVFNLCAPAEPVAAATVRTVDEIRAVIRHALAEELQVRVMTTGHSAGGVRPMRGAVLVRTALQGGVEVDSQRRVARFPAGTLWGAVVEAAAPHGLTAPHGSSPTVGAVGYLLRGGLSFYGRKVGLGVNSIRAIELVTSDGELRRVDASSDAELFWALRGGGGGLGVVTAVEIDLFPATDVVSGAAFWSADNAHRLISSWRRWTENAPREVTTSLRVMNLPPLPEVPPALAGRTTLSIDGAVLAIDGDVATAQQQADDLLGPLRALAEPLLDTWQLSTPAAVLQAHMDPTEPVPFVGDHMLLGELGDDGVAEFLRVTGPGSGSPLVVATLRQLGGAFAEPARNGGALDRLDARYAYMGSGVPFEPITPEALESHCAIVRTALTPWDTGQTVPSFVENYRQPQRHLTPDRVHAVDRVRDRVDPLGVFRGDIAPNATARQDAARDAA